jgi:transketolase
MQQVSVQQLKETAKKIRVDVVNSLFMAGSGHLGASLGLADIFTTLYFHLLNHDPKNPDLPERDRFILSIGHVAPVYYATLAHSGYFPIDELASLRKLGSRLQGHPGKDHGLSGIELSAGSLGQGLSVAVGMALAAKIDKENWTVCCLLGDGEPQEGSVWEAAMSASHHKLSGLIAVVDRNGVQIDGLTSDVMEIEPLRKKWESFAWSVFECNGNDIESFIDAYKEAEMNSKGPSVILAKTEMGKGVPEIENDYRWHGKVPDQNQAQRFVEQIMT